MVWAIEFDEAAKKELAKLDRQVASRLLDFLKQRCLRRFNADHLCRLKLDQGLLLD